MNVMSSSIKVYPQVALVAKTLNNEIIGRSAIDTINKAMNDIDLREQSQEVVSGAEPESTQVLKLIINKVKHIFENINNHTTEDFISIFYLSKVIDFPEITDVFNKMVITRSPTDSEKKRLVKDIAKLIPPSLSENQLKEDFSELISQIGKDYLDPTLIEDKLRDIRKRNDFHKKLQEKGYELLRFQLTNTDQLRAVKSQHNASQKGLFDQWIFFKDGDIQTVEKDILGNICFQIQKNPELQNCIELAQQSMKCTNNNILVFLGTTQVGKSSTLNFLSGQIPFIDRGYLYKEDFKILDERSDQKSASISKEVFSYLINDRLINVASLSDSDEEIEEFKSDSSGSPDSNQQFYIPTFNIGERISGESDNEDKNNLRKFILKNFHEIKRDFVFKFIVNLLEGAIRRKERSERLQGPGIGFRNPIFSYGVGKSTTSVAQAKIQDWNATTIDLPGSGDSRGEVYSLLSAFSTYRTLEQTNSVKGAAIILSYEQLTIEATAIEGLIKVLSSADNMMGESIGPSNICILVTKVPLTKKSKNGKMVPRKSHEITNLVAKELNKLSNLLAQSESPDLLRLKALLTEVINGKRFMPITPLKDLEDGCLEESDPTNVNKENKEEIIKMLSNLNPIKVNSNYFSQTYSSQNGNISRIIGQIEDAILNISSVIRNELEELKSLFKALSERYKQISISIDIAYNYINEIKKHLESEQKIFDEVMANYLVDDGSRKANAFSIKKESNLTADEIKNLAIIHAKQKTIGETDRFQALENPYQSNTNSDIRVFEEKVKEKKEDIKHLEKKIAELESKKETDGEKNVIVQSKKFPDMDNYWYPGDQTTTLEHYSDYPVKPNYKLQATKGIFRVNVNREQTADKYRAEFIITRREKAGIFSKYKMTCQVFLEASARDITNHEIKVKQVELKRCQEDLLSLTQRLETFKETEVLNEKLNRFEQKKRKIVSETQQQYHESLAKLQKELQIKEDKSQIMSISDILKLMIGMLVNNANQSFKEIQHTLDEAQAYFQKQDRPAIIYKIKSGIKNYRTLDQLLLITKALNFKSRYNNAVTVMNISEMEEAEELIISLEDKIKNVVTDLKNCETQIDMIQQENSWLKLDIDKYDKTLERIFADEDKKGNCILI